MKKEVGNHKNLMVWKKGIELVKQVYAETDSFPDSEKFGLTSQIRRSVISIPSNIAEECGRCSSNELIRFLYIVLGSAAELETQIILSKELNFLEENNAEKLISLNIEIIKMTTSLINSIKTLNN
jgi:four helix bundle protein